MKNLLVCITVLALISSVLSRVTTEEDCNRPNESWLRCSATVNNCEPSCDDPRPYERFCTLMCGAGCDCNFGYFRSSNGSCVLPSEC